MTKAIGLDFGTTNSALAVARPDRSVKLARFNGHPTFRSILYFDAADSQTKGGARVVAGPAAINSYLNAESPGRLIQSAKSYLASRLFRKTQIFGATYTLEELIGIILKELRSRRSRVRRSGIGAGSRTARALQRRHCGCRR